MYVVTLQCSDQGQFHNVIILFLRDSKSSKMPLSLGYHGNIVDLWWVRAQMLTSAFTTHLKEAAPFISNCCYLFSLFTSAPVTRERLQLEYERTGELLVDLGSDQTSLHNPFNGGYYPVQLSLRQANQLMSTDPQRFRTMVQERFDDSPFLWMFSKCLSMKLKYCVLYVHSLKRQIKAINKLSDAGMFFWDYGNAFLLEAKRAGNWL